MVIEMKHNAEANGYCEFLGLSTDTKPMNCGINSLFLELDTGKVCYFDGTDWLEVGGSSNGGSDVDSGDGK